jgi:Protein of unknown function (DUF3352)
MTDDLTQPIETPNAGSLTTDGAVAQPVAAVPVTVTPQGGGRMRWAVAIGVAGLAIVAAIGAVILFGQQAAPSALAYIPGDAAIVTEVRLDLPGDQMQKLGNLLAHFPGFADQATLAAKLDEALGNLVQSASDGKANYVTDLKPWVNGPLFVGILDLSMTTTTAASAPPDVVISATTNGGVSCATLFKNETPTHETYQSLDLVLNAAGTMACVVDGHQALLGNPATVRKALDAKAAGTGMDKSASYTAARKALGGDRLATLYFDGAALQKLIPATTQAGIPDVSALMGQVPSWLMTGVRAEDDGFVLDYVGAPVPPATGPSLVADVPAHPSVIAPMVPGDTLLFVEAQGAGVSIQNLLTKLHQVPELAEALKTLDGLGSPSDLVGWIDDAGVTVSMHGTTPDVAVLLVAKDEAAVTSRVASLKTLLALAGPNNGIDVKSSSINGIDVTTVTIADVGALIPSGSVPGGATLPTTGPISFSIAANGKVLILTSGEAAMTALLGATADSSLAANAAFKHAGTLGLPTAQTTVYLAAGAGLELAKGFLSADQLATYQKDAAAYLAPLEGVLFQAANDANGSRSRIVVTVAKT